MNRSFFRNTVAMLLSLSMLIGLAGCSAKGANSIIKYAKRTHGDCEVISKTEEEGKTTVVLKDSLQGFEYTITSSMQDIYIDGSLFGSVEGETDTFRMEAINYAVDKAKVELTTVCYKYDITYEVDSNVDLITITLNEDGFDASLIAYDFYSVIKKYNVDGRLDGLEIVVDHSDKWLEDEYAKLREDESISEYDTVFSSAGGAELRRIGSITLPNGAFVYGDIEE